MKVKFDAKVKLDPVAIAKLEQSAREAMASTMDSFQTEVSNAQVIPRGHGDLMTSQGVSFDIANKGLTAYLSYNTPYARRLYYNPQYNFRMDKNTNARGKWLEDWIFGPKKDWLPNAFSIFFKEKSGGLIK
jgi:hypothetical protein